MKTGTILAEVALESDGSVDEVTTLQNAEAAVAEGRKEHAALVEAIDSQFKSQLDAEGNEKIQPKIYFISGVLARLNVSPENYSKMESRVTEFVDANSDKDNAQRAFTITRGKGGGVRRGAVAAK